MISEYRFIKESSALGLPENFSKNFYNVFSPLLDIIKKGCEYSDKNSSICQLSEDDWKRILNIHEEKLWPLLIYLSEPSLKIYQDIDPEKKHEADKFRTSIASEMQLRKNRQLISPGEYVSVLKLLFEQRFEFILTIFEVDKGRGWWKIAFGVALASGAIAGGAYLWSKGKTKTSEEEKK